MIAVGIFGGLGNQMFQYACGKSVALRAGASLCLSCDLLGVIGNHRQYELGKVFKIDVPKVSSAQLTSALGWRGSRWARVLQGRILKRRSQLKGICVETAGAFNDSVLSVQSPAYLFGYWQDARYFSDHSRQIRSDFSFALPLSTSNARVASQIAEAPSVSIHVRRGDYLKSVNRTIYAACDEDYYIRAMRLVSKETGARRFFVFSDDPQWVAGSRVASLPGVALVSHNSGDEAFADMHLMSLCTHHIIANSTFSWWGAWLSAEPGKMVVAPSRWFRDVGRNSHIVPDGWIRI